jgi:hypothetical protein
MDSRSVCYSISSVLVYPAINAVTRYDTAVLIDLIVY